MLAKIERRQDGLLVSRQQDCPICQQQTAKGRRALARSESGYLPHENPCAQCGKPIAAPDWIESGPRSISYLWHCRACDYRFEAVAYFGEQQLDQEALAA